MKLLVAISLTLTSSHAAIHSAGVRRSEPQPLTAQQKSDIIKMHNVLRASQGAADMEYMTWNDSLAVAAANWAAGCRWAHGTPPVPGTTLTEYGQNLYMKGGAKLNVSECIQDWFDEKDDDDCHTPGCTPRISCGHYYEIMAAQSHQVGCANHYCSTMDNLRFNSTHYFVCNYLPGGADEENPFSKGPPCSKCGGGAGWCKDGLCNSRCSETGKDCRPTCEAVCHNCAKLDLKTCRCSCADGWSGPDCSEPCKERNDNCNPKPGITGWPPNWCNHTKHGRTVQNDCPVMCGLCNPYPNAEANKCSPVFAAAEARMLVSSTKSPSSGNDNVDKDDDDDNGCQHQQQRSTVALLSHVILSLTITRKALH